MGKSETDAPRRRQRTIAAVVACALFTVITFKPAPASADDNAWIYAGIGVGVYFTFIIVAAAVIYGAAPDTSAIPISDLERSDLDSSPVHVGSHCMQRDGQMPLFCW